MTVSGSISFIDWINCPFPEDVICGDGQPNVVV